MPGALLVVFAANPPRSQCSASSSDTMKRPATALAALSALLAAASALQASPAAQGLTNPDLGSRSRLQRGCVLLDAVGRPRFSSAACAGNQMGPRLLQQPSAQAVMTSGCTCPPRFLAGAPAQASFLPGRHTRGGWHQLWVSTSDAFPDEQQALALGYAEGWLTGEGSLPSSSPPILLELVGFGGEALGLPARTSRRRRPDCGRPPIFPNFLAVQTDRA